MWNRSWMVSTGGVLMAAGWTATITIYTLATVYPWPIGHWGTLALVLTALLTNDRLTERRAARSLEVFHLGQAQGARQQQVS